MAINWWTEKQSLGYPHNDYLDEILVHATKWLDLENVMLSERI